MYRNARRLTRRSGAALLVLSLAILAALATPASAQPSFAISFGRGMSSLAAPGESSGLRPATSATIDVEHQLAGERLRLFYDLEAGSPVAGPDWRYFEHLVGATIKAPLGSGSKAVLYLTPAVTWHTNGAAWDDANYHGLGGRANLELRPVPSMTVRTGYSIDRRIFPSLTEMNQTEQGAFGSVLASFSTRTTLIGEARIGRKSYEATTLQGGAYAAPGWPAAFGRDHGMGPALRLGTALPVVTIGSPSASNQLAWLARVAQSVADRTGVWAQVAQRVAFGATPPAVIATPPLYYDDGVYDDPFGSDAWTLSANAKHQFSGGMVLEARVVGASKHYNSTFALDLDGETLPGSPLRRDRLQQLLASWTLPLMRERTGRVALELGVGYSFNRHRSNDLYYNYTSHALGLGLSVAY